MYIEEFCKIVEFFVKNRTAEKFLRITPTKTLRFYKLPKIINELSSSKSEILVKRSELNKEYSADNSKLLNIIGNIKFTSYQEGMKTLYKELNSEK